MPKKFSLLPLFSVFLLLMLFQVKAYSQACPGNVGNLIYTNPVITCNTAQFDIAIRNAGTTTLTMLACAGGFTYNPTALNGGTLTATAIKFPPANPINNLNATGNLTVQPATNQVRWAHTPISGVSVPLTNSFVAFYRVTLTNSVPFSGSVPLVLTPNFGLSVSFSNTSLTVYCNGNPNSTNLSSTQAGTLPQPPALIFPFADACASGLTSNITNPTCFGGVGSAEITLTASCAMSTNTGTYSVNGGAPVAYTSNPFTILGLSQGNYTITVTDDAPSSCASFDGFITVGAGTGTGASSFVTETVCDSYTWSINNQTYTTSGVYTNVSTDAQGCQVNDTLDLVITNSTSSVDQQTACDNYSWALSNQTYAASGIYVVVNGCHTDSLDLTIIPYTSSAVSISACDNYTWSLNNQNYTSSGTYVEVNGCQTDSLILTISPNTSTMTSETACNNFLWAANNTVYNVSGIYTFVSGCNTDSLDLTILPGTGASTLTTITACDSYPWAANNQTYASSGTYLNINGCDVDSLVLTIVPSTSSLTTITACDSYTWSVNGQTYNWPSSGIYTSVTGCHTDSLDLSLNASVAFLATITTCNSFTWEFNNQTYTSSGSYSHVSGCTTGSLDLVINPSPVLTATDSSICQGTSAQFSAVNGSIFNFFINGNSMQNGSNPDYFAFGISNNDVVTVRADGDSNCVSLPITMTVNPAPSIGASAIATNICLGSSVNLAATSTAPGASFTWTKDYTNYYPITVADVPSSIGQQTYSITVTDLNNCSFFTSVFINVNTGTNTLALSSNGNTLSVGGNQIDTLLQSDGLNLNYADANCNLIATVSDSTGGNILALTLASVEVDANIQTWLNQPYVKRHYTIVPSSQGLAIVTLYLTQGDFDDYNVYASANGWPLLPTSSTDLAGIDNLRITKVSGGALGVGTPEVITPALLWNASNNYWEATFSISSFSEFYFHAKNPLNAPLPVSLIAFKGEKLSTSNKLTWVSRNEVNNAAYILAHSVDALNYNEIAFVDSKALNGNSIEQLAYEFIHVNPKAGHNYYRLSQKDLDGKSSSFSQIIDLYRNAEGNTLLIYPNPTSGIVNIDFTTQAQSKVTIKVLDVTGRLVKQIQLSSQVGHNAIQLSLSELSSGTYQIQILENSQLSFTSKMTKE